MSEAQWLADKLNSLCVAEFAWPHLNNAATELRRLAPMEAELQKAREELAALRAAVPAIPAGWQPVPVEPTAEMFIRGGEVFFDTARTWRRGSTTRDQDSALSIYCAMIEASPQAPQAAQPRKPLFEDLIAQHPGLREELLEIAAQPTVAVLNTEGKRPAQGTDAGPV
jgi:hypothetical protein